MNIDLLTALARQAATLDDLASAGYPDNTELACAGPAQGSVFLQATEDPLCVRDLRVIQAALMWKPIGTVPRIGRQWVELWWPALQERGKTDEERLALGRVIARWDGGWWNGIGTSYALVEPGPTHWRHLLPGPAQEIATP